MVSAGRIGLLFLLCAGAAMAVTPRRFETRCGGGGEGPKPFQDVSLKLLSGTSLIKTSGGLRDWLFWESSNSIVHTTDTGELIETLLPSGQERTLSGYGGPLARVVDDESRFLVSDKDSWVFDRSAERWSHFVLAARPLQHLYWFRDNLYSLNLNTDRVTQDFNLYRYRAGAQAAEPVCSFRAIGMDLKVAHGHQFPFLVLYGTTGSKQSPRLSVYKIDVRKCGIAVKFDFKDPIDGPVRDVFRFEELDAIAVQVDHPTKNLLFEISPSGCRYFDLKGATPLVGNYGQPIVATWSQKEGLTLFNLKSETMGRVLKDIPFTPVTQNDLWLSSNGERLFLSPTVQGETTRSLLELKLASFKQ